ncbi:MAG: hypothetical protein Q4F53_06555, partial [Nesterenkonia sp.]|nr:hypothetical protein [Nesterenkonia sp.]
MSEGRPPRESAAVYRRRRIVAGVLAFLVLVGVAWGISALVTWIMGGEDETVAEEGQDVEDDVTAGGDADDADTGTETEDAEDTSVDGTGDEDAVEGSCDPADISVTASTGSDGYAADEAPLLVMSIENTGSDGCSVDVGTGQQEFAVSHQGREVFTTAQCSEDDASMEIDLEPGQLERAQVNWPRSDSSVDCSEPAELESGTYELTVRLSGITSEP